MTIGQKITILRTEKGLSQSELAKQMNVSNSTVSMWEQNKRAVTSEAVLQLAEIFNVTTDYLLGKNKTPRWANEQDTYDLKKFLDDNDGTFTYGGDDLTDDEKEKLQIAMTQIFWDRHKHD